MKLIELLEERTTSGKSTRGLGTTRATAADIQSALNFVAKHTGIAKEKLKANLLGSTHRTLAGKQPDSGDIDVAVELNTVNQAQVVQQLLDATGTDEIHRAGKGVFSFAVPVQGGNKVQVDLMFAPSAEWAKWAFHSAMDSQYKAVVRSLLFVNLMKQLFEPGKDLEIKEDGETVIRVRRSFKADQGLERLFKLRPMRKDGKGRTKSLVKVTPKQIQAELDRLGRSDKFDPHRDPITNATQATELMFGAGVKPDDVLSVEQVVTLIKKRKDASTIFKNAAKDLEGQHLKLPPELSQYA